MPSTTKTRGTDQVLVDSVSTSPVDRQQRRFWWRLILLVILLLVILFVGGLLLRFLRDEPVRYQDPEQHFKYGSIGSEPGGSITSPVGGVLPPAQIFAVLPDMFPDRLPGGYASLGLILEPDMNRPIGVSQRERLGLKMAGLNCAVCHTGTLRTGATANRQIIPGMPSHQLDLQGLFAFTLDSILDPRFTPDAVTAAVEKRFGPLGFLDQEILKRFVVPQLREQTLQLRSRIGLLLNKSNAWGPGRVDTFNPYKALQFNWQLRDLPPEELVGASDFPAIWNQNIRRNMNLHWDGNNASLAERNLSAGLGAGITPVTADHPAIERVAGYLQDLPPPAWPKEFSLNQEHAALGQKVYAKHCAECHDLHGEKIGKVTPLSEIDTDPQRLNSYTQEFANNQNTLFPNTKYRFTHFRKTNGYSNQPLDGIWARAPYLHNGSVPTLADLLKPVKDRPTDFYRGCDIYDAVNVGFISNLAEETGRKFFKYDTKQLGNSNAGHEYGVDMPDTEKRNLLEYLKTL